jgi:hypothetical protein
VPAQSDRHPAPTGRHHLGVDPQLRIVSRRRHHDPVREREGRSIDDGARSHARDVTRRRQALDRPARLSDEQTVDRQPVLVALDRHAVEVDRDATDPVALL